MKLKVMIVLLFGLIGTATTNEFTVRPKSKKVSLHSARERYCHALVDLSLAGFNMQRVIADMCEDIVSQVTKCIQGNSQSVIMQQTKSALTNDEATAKKLLEKMEQLSQEIASFMHQ